jgi:hypothetical protein
MEEFNTNFNNLVKSLPADILPSDTAILIYYMEALEGEMRYALRDKDPQNLKLAQALAIRVDKNMQDARKSNIPGFTRGSSSKVSPYLKLSSLLAQIILRTFRFSLLLLKTLLLVCYFRKMIKAMINPLHI